MSDSWSYTLLWQIAGRNPPNLHEDEFTDLSNVLNAVSTEVSHVVQSLNRITEALKRDIHASTIDTVHKAWTTVGRHKLSSVAGQISSLAYMAGMTASKIWEFKSGLVLAVGAYDIAQVATGGVLAVGRMLGVGLAVNLTKKINEIIDEKIADLESKVLHALYDGSQLDELVRDISRSVGSELKHLFDDMTRAVAHEATAGESLHLDGPAIETAVADLRSIVANVRGIRAQIQGAPGRTGRHETAFQKLFAEVLDDLQSGLPDVLETLVHDFIRHLGDFDAAVSSTDRDLAAEGFVYDANTNTWTGTY